MDYSDKYSNEASPLLQINVNNIASNGLIKINDLINKDFMEMYNYRTKINQQVESATRNNLIQNEY